MRPDTKVHIAIVNVGDSQDKGELFHGPLTDVIRFLITYLGKNTMHKRFDIAIAREQDIVVKRLLTDRAQKGITLESIADEMDELMSRIPVDDEEDTYTGPTE